MAEDRNLMSGNEVNDWETLMFLYGSAIKEINTKSRFSGTSFSLLIITIPLNM